MLTSTTTEEHSTQGQENNSLLETEFASSDSEFANMCGATDKKMAKKRKRIKCSFKGILRYADRCTTISSAYVVAEKRVRRLKKKCRKLAAKLEQHDPPAEDAETPTGVNRKKRRVGPLGNEADEVHEDQPTPDAKKALEELAECRAQKTGLEEQLRLREAELADKDRAFEEASAKHLASHQRHEEAAIQQRAELEKLKVDKLQVEESARDWKDKFVKKQHEVEALREEYSRKVVSMVALHNKEDLQAKRLNEQTQRALANEIAAKEALAARLEEVEAKRRKREAEVQDQAKSALETRKRLQNHLRCSEEKSRRLESRLSQFKEMHARKTFANPETKEMMAGLDKLLIDKLGPNDPRIMRTGQLDPAQLKRRGLKVDSQGRLSHVENSDDKFDAMFAELSCAVYRAPAAGDSKTTFCPARIFEKQGGVYVLKACNVTQPMAGKKVDPEMDPWVALVRTTYSEQQANDILNYLLNKYNEAWGVEATYKVWDRPVRGMCALGCEMEPLKKLHLLLELSNKGDHSQ